MPRGGLHALLITLLASLPLFSDGFSAPFTASAKAPVETSIRRVDCPVLIVGAGPAGLACALTLARRGTSGIHVLDYTPGPEFFELGKAYLYRIDGRGQRLTDILDLTPDLVQVGVTTSEFLHITVVDSKGTVRLVRAPADPNQQPAYWLPRQALLKFLWDRIAQDHKDQVTFHYGVSSEELLMPDDLEDAGQPARVRARLGDGSQVDFSSLRVVACDGIRSRVRSSLQRWAAEKLGKPGKFGLRSVDSPSAGLQYKILSLQPSFPLHKGSAERTNHMTCYSYVGVPRGWGRPPLRLGCLPYKMSSIPRTANIIVPEGSEVLRLDTADKVLGYLEAQFPQCDIRAMVSLEEAARFAATPAGAFPKPQYCTDVQQRIGGGVGGVVLLGDAIHAFPPDLGAGVNSAFEDVLDLCFALDRCGGMQYFGQAIGLYERMRAPQSRAICELIPIGFPQQYNHMPVGKAIKLFGVAIRAALARLLPFAISPPVFFMIQDCRLDYAEIWKRARRTTAIFYVLGAAAAWAVASRSKAWQTLLQGALKFMGRAGIPA